MAAKLGYNKIRAHFKKRYMWKEQELFNYCSRYGFTIRDLQLLLSFWRINASYSAIIRYIRLEGLDEGRKMALQNKPRRKFRRKWSIKDYVIVR